jgi:CheY-like chemotaxis protein
MMHTVLLLEDEEELREMMTEALERAGFHVVAVADGRAALDAIPRIEKICLVLLDLLMPGMNGWDFFAAFMGQPELASIPVVVHTSAPDRAPAGATKVLRKPLSLDRLVGLAREFCTT